MKSRQIMFYGVKEDITPIIEEIESHFNLHYYECGLFDEIIRTEYTSISQIVDIGFTEFGDWIRDIRFLALSLETKLYAEDVPQRTGGIKYAVDSSRNPKSITIQLGGICKQHTNVMVAGQIAAGVDDSFSNELYEFISKKIKKEFIKVGAFYIGRESLNHLKSGWRFVLDVRRNEEYDLKI